MFVFWCYSIKTDDIIDVIVSVILKACVMMKRVMLITREHGSSRMAAVLGAGLMLSFLSFFRPVL